jgi:hypothetical protein
MELKILIGYHSVEFWRKLYDCRSRVWLLEKTVTVASARLVQSAEMSVPPMLGAVVGPEVSFVVIADQIHHVSAGLPDVVVQDAALLFVKLVPADDFLPVERVLH